MEINIEKKRRSLWVWIVGLIVIAIVVWLAARIVTGGREVQQDPPGSAETRY